MPFASKAQMKQCFALQAQGNSNWNCKESYHKSKTKFAKLPDYVVHTGPRGGKYILKYGQKIYQKAIN